MAPFRIKDLWSGSVLLVVSVLIVWGSGDLIHGNARNPGPGFFPFWIGTILGAMSIGLILKAAQAKEEGRPSAVKEANKDRIFRGRVLLVILALVLYGFAMDYLGFITVTFLFMFCLLRFIEPQPWKTSVGWALVGSIGAYLVFEVWFSLRLPRGFWGV